MANDSQVNNTTNQKEYNIDSIYTIKKCCHYCRKVGIIITCNGKI